MAIEKCLKFITRTRIEEDGFRPTLSRSQHVSVGKAAAGGKAFEVGKRYSATDNVAHVHVIGVKAGSGKGLRHFQLSVDALLAKDRDPWCPRPTRVQRDSVFGRIEGKPRVETCICPVFKPFIFLLRRDRIISKRLDQIAGFAPGQLQVNAFFGQQGPGGPNHPQFIALVRMSDDVTSGGEPGVPQYLHDRRTIGFANLYHRTEFFAEQRCQDRIGFTQLLRRVADVVIIDIGFAFRVGECVQINRHATVRGEHHLDQRNQQSAIRTIMVGKDFLIAREPPDGCKKVFKARRVVQVRRDVAHLSVDLCQCRRAQAVLAIAQINQQQFGIGCSMPRSFKQRCQGFAGIENLCKSGDHQ